MSSKREIVFFPLLDLEKDDRKVVLRLWYFLTSSHKSVVAVGSSLDLSASGASLSLLKKRTCMKESRERRQRLK